MGERLDVLHEGGGPADSSFARRRWCGGWRSDAGVDQVHRGARIPGHVTGGRGDDPDNAALAGSPFGDSLRHGPERGVVSLADIEDDLICADRGRREQRPVEDEVGARGHQVAVLLAVRLAFRAVGDDDCRSARRGDGAPLSADRKGCASSPGEVRAVEEVDQVTAASRQRAQPGIVSGDPLWSTRQLRPCEQPEPEAHLGSRRSTAAWNEDRASARGSRDRAASR